MTCNTSAVAVCCSQSLFQFGIARGELPLQLGIFAFEGGLPVLQHRRHVPVRSLFWRSQSTRYVADRHHC